METKFDDLVRGLSAEMFDELRRAVAEENGQRRQQTAIQLEQIHPRMTNEAREQAAAEIARVLNGAGENA